mgnify:CR=1 FL=1
MMTLLLACNDAVPRCCTEAAVSKSDRNRGGIIGEDILQYGCKMVVLLLLKWAVGRVS